MQFVSVQYNSTLYHQVVKLRDAILRKPLNLVFSTEDLAVDSTELLFALVTDNKPVACLQFKIINDTDLKLRQMAVATKFQKLGIGSKLVTFAEVFVEKQGYKNIELHARSNAVLFYKKLGYIVASDEFLEVNIPHFKMIKLI